MDKEFVAILDSTVINKNTIVTHRLKEETDCMRFHQLCTKRKLEGYYKGLFIQTSVFTTVKGTYLEIKIS